MDVGRLPQQFRRKGGGRWKSGTQYYGFGTVQPNGNKNILSLSIA